VQVEVVARQVGEERPHEAGASDALEGYAVRGDLHDDPADPRFRHPGEGLLHLRSLRGGADRRPTLAAADHLGGRHEPTRLFAVGAGEDRVERVRGGGLTVGAGHAVDLHLPRGVAGDGACEGG
jgi:hypothetical protein